MSRGNFANTLSRIAELSRRNELMGRGASPVLKPAPPPCERFADSTWRAESAIRECVDALVHPTRWRVTVLPSDHAPRQFILRGSLESVTHRAQLIFAEETRVLAIEPATHVGGESFDHRLNIIGRSS